MGVRKHQRRIARAKMERAGIKHINKPSLDIYGNRRGPSYFATHWKRVLGFGGVKNG